jgi:hypothetical protein
VTKRRVRDTDRGRGNRCAHNPRAWRATLNRPHHRLPPVCSIAADCFHRALSERGKFPELQRCLRELQIPLFGRKRATLSQRRSELLEVLSLVVRALLVRMDVLSLRVGWHNRRFGRDGKRHDFQGLPVKTIANWTGRDESSVKRALRILRWLGWVPGPGKDGPWIIDQPMELTCDKLHDHKHRTKDEGGCFEYFPGVRRFTYAFFQALGIDGQLDQAREYKTQKAAAARAAGLAAVIPIRPRSADRRPATINLIQTLAAKLAYKPPDDG